MTAPDDDAPTGPAPLRAAGSREPTTYDARIVWRLAQSPAVVMSREEHDALVRAAYAREREEMQR